MEEVKGHKLAFLSNNICQDPLEGFFGCQRQRGGTSDNPSALEFYNNTQALRVVDSFCRGPVRGNCRGSAASERKQNKRKQDKGVDCTPLPRRTRSKTLFHN